MRYYSSLREILCGTRLASAIGMSQLANDFRYGCRVLWKHRGFTAMAIIALGIGIGANASMYSMADALLYRPLQLPDLDRAVMIYGTTRGMPAESLQITQGDFDDFRRNSTTLDHVSAVLYQRLGLTGGGDPETVTGYAVTASVFDALASAPIVGRTFRPEEDQERVVVLAHSLWTSRFGADPRVLGTTLNLEGKQHQVIGVMPKEFRFPADAQLWLPLHIDTSDRRVFGFDAVGRLKPGISIGQARAEIRTVADRISAAFPVSHKKRTARLALVREAISGELTAGFSRMLVGAVAFLLLIACANVANLQFARVSMRGREIAVRTAVGAKRWHILRQLLVENILLTGLSIVVGLLIAVWGLDLMRAGMSPGVVRYLPGWERAGLNLPVLAITIAVAFAAGILSGILPAWVGSKTDILGVLKEGGRTSAGKARHRLRSILVVSEIVLALVLLIGAGLLVKGLRNVTAPRPGMDPAHVLTFSVDLPKSRFAGAEQIRQFEQDLLGRLSGLPGVSTASMVTDIPFSGGSRSVYIGIDGRPPDTGGERTTAQIQAIDGQYFRTLRIPLINGREFTRADGPEAPAVAIVSEKFVKRYLAGRDPIGHRIRFGDDKAPWITVVGVAGDVLHEAFDSQARPTVYQPYLQASARRASFAIRAPGDPSKLASSVRAQVAAVKPDQPLAELLPYSKLISDHLLGYTYVAVLMGIFGFIALMLSAIGVYGVMAYSVSERTHEIGLRMALGADRGDVLWMIGRWGMGLAVTGMALGLPAALGLSKLLSGLLFGISAFDVPTFATGVGVLCIAAMAACLAPARRAVAVDPMVTLRNE